MGAVDISSWGLAAAFGLVLVPLGLDYWLKLGLARDTVVSIGRMALQLLAVGFFLEFVFGLDKWWLNLAWFGLMVGTTVVSAVFRAKVNLKSLIGWIALGFGVPTLLVLVFFNAVVLDLSYVFEARYLIALSGMLLGNVLSSNIVALNSFFQGVQSQQKMYLYRLAMGATRSEALMPYFRNSVQLAVTPVLAKTATIGLVSLPGMMSGQIIGGSSPNTAIKYQIAIMIAIYVVSLVSLIMSLVLSGYRMFDGYGVLKKGLVKGS